MLNNKEILEVLCELNTIESLLVGDAVKCGLSLEEAYCDRLNVKVADDTIITWLSGIHHQCKEMTGANVYVLREHMSQ